jgi:hypothetical protein
MRIRIKPELSDTCQVCGSNIIDYEEKHNKDAMIAIFRCSWCDTPLVVFSGAYGRYARRGVELARQKEDEAQRARTERKGAV